MFTKLFLAMIPTITLVRYFSCGLLFFSGLGWSQSSDKNPLIEIKANLLEITAAQGLSLSLEKLSPKNQSFGISLYYAPSGDFRNESLEGALYYRFFFPKNDAPLSHQRWFVEALANASWIEVRDDFIVIAETLDTYYTYRKYRPIGVGAALGYKWVFSKNWTAEILLGGGGYLTESPKSTFPRLGISIGKRF